MNLPRVSFLALLLTLPATSAYADFFTNFDNQNDSGLTRVNPLTISGQGGSYGFPQLGSSTSTNFGYQLTQAGVAAANNVAGPARLGSVVTGQTFGAVTESVDVVNFDGSLGQAFGLGTRFNNIGLGTTNGYALLYLTPTGSDTGTGNFLFNKITGEQSDVLGSQVAITLLVGHSYRFTLSAIGSNLSGQLFDLSNPSIALATVNATDSAYASGAAGVIGAAAKVTPTSGVNVTFDNLLVQSVPEPSSFALCGIAGLAGLGMAWRRRKRVA
jgi:hypothetical protein